MIFVNVKEIDVIPSMVSLYNYIIQIHVTLYLYAGEILSLAS